MNLRSTTPNEAFFAVVKFLLASALFLVIVFLLSLQPVAAQDNQERQARIDELSKLIEDQSSNEKSLDDQGKDISSQLSALKKEKQGLESQLQKNTRDYTVVSKDIAASASALKEKQATLGRLMANMYVDGTKTPLELLAGSESVTDFIDQRTYQSVAQDEFRSALKDVQSTKTRLLAQQKELKNLLVDQNNQATALATKQKDQELLFVATEGKSAHLQKITKEMAEERRILQSQQQASIVQMMGSAEQVITGSISEPIVEAPRTEEPVVTVSPPSNKPTPPKNPTPKPTPTPAPSAPTKPKPKPKPPVILPNGGYPSYLQNCYVDANALSYGIDPWGYGCRQCVSYTAWKVLQRTGKSAMYWGNAKQWPASAARVGYRTGTTPKAHSVGVMTSGPYGHVVWVEKVNRNGTINVSQYNYWLGGTSNGGWGWYSEFKNVSPRAYNVYIYF